MLFGVIPFIDRRYDVNELQFKHDDERRVSSYAEMYEKAQDLSKIKFLQLQQKGFEQLKEIQTGDEAYKYFMRSLE